MSWFRLGVFAVLLVVAGACEKSKPIAVESLQAEFATPGPGDVATVVRLAVEKATKEKRRLLVYVGAHWCEPCTYFQEAVTSGALPQELSTLRFLKFDYDADKERLMSAGYQSRMIPLFVVPNADGTASEQRFEGAVKGPEASGLIVAKLQALLEP